VALSLRITTISLDPRDGCAVIVLEHAESGRQFPLWLGDEDAASVVAALDGRVAAAGATHDLMLGIVSGLGARVAWVSLDSILGGVVQATVALEHTDDPFELQSTAGDAIALAVRASAPILIEPLLLERVSDAVREAEARVQAERRAGGAETVQQSQAERWNQLIHHLATHGPTAGTPEA